MGCSGFIGLGNIHSVRADFFRSQRTVTVLPVNTILRVPALALVSRQSARLQFPGRRCVKLLECRWPRRGPPTEAADLTPAQTCGQLGVEKVEPDFIPCDDLHEHLQMLVCQYLLCPLTEPGSSDLLGRVTGNQVGPAVPPSAHRGTWCGCGAPYRWPDCHSVSHKTAGHPSV